MNPSEGARRTQAGPEGTFALRPLELAEVHLRAHEALARQSVPGLFAHWVLAAVILATSSVARQYPASVVVAALWLGLVGVSRLAVAKSFERLYPTRPTLWSRLFWVGVLLSSGSWGLGGAVLMTAGGASRDSWLVLLTVAGICAGGLISLSADLGLLRMHIACLVVPTLAAGVLMPGSASNAVGLGVVMFAFVAFLWIQGSHVNASFMQALRTTRLLERHAADLEIAQLESLEASREKSEFLANMSHEIRTPMTAVVGYADLLLDPSIGPSGRASHIQAIRRNGQHLMSLVDDILDVSKIEAGKMTVENIATSPRKIVIEVASLVRPRAVEKNLSFSIKYASPVPETILSDPTRLKQIVMNLVSNAVKFTEKGGVTVAVRCEAPESRDPRLVIEVADTGIGMTALQLKEIFTSFVQADASTTRRFGGSGLGLAISKSLAGLLGGDVVAQSWPGRGSLFRLTLSTGPLSGVPMVHEFVEAGLSDPPGTTGASSPSMRRVVVLPSCRVLLAEDGYDNQVLISAFLTKAGATVKVVGDGQLAVEEASAAEAEGTPYDVILMDMQMPVLDGYGATSNLRLRGYKGAIVALTAHAMVGDRERCLSAGCDAYLTKPVDRAQLTAILARFTAKAGGPADALVSTLADDEEMKEILGQFVQELPERSAAILRASQASDVETLQRLAHQLKGAAGGYGFPRITEAAGAVEEGLAQGIEGPVLRSRVEALASLCRRARAA